MPHDFAANATGLRRPADHEAQSIREVLLRMPSPTLARIAEDDVRRRVDAAIADGGGILMVGLATDDIEVERDRFRAIAHVRLTDGSRLDVRFGGSLDHLGRVEAREATLAA